MQAHNTFNISRLLCYLECPKKAFWRYIENIEPVRDEPPKAINFGSAIHEGLAAGYMAGFNNDQVLTATLDAFHDHYVGDEQRDYGVAMLEKYWEKFSGDFDEWEIVGAELGFEGQLPHWDTDVPPTILGRPDLIIRTEDNRVFNVQHKTVGHSVGLDTYVEAYDLHWHELSYAMLVQPLLREGDVFAGSILNLLRKTKVPSYARFYLPIHDHLVNEFYEDAAEVIYRWQTGKFVKNPGSCRKWNSLCPYYQKCLGQAFGQWEYTSREPDYVDERNNREVEGTETT